MADRTGALAKGEERREHIRYPLHLRVMLAIGRTILHGRTEDISDGGASVRLDDRLPEGTRIAIRILTPYMDQFSYIDLQGTVQYSTITSGNPPCRAGVKFGGTDAETKRRLCLLWQAAQTK